MKEMNESQIEEVSGGVLPLVYVAFTLGVAASSLLVSDTRSEK